MNVMTMVISRATRLTLSTRAAFAFRWEALAVKKVPYWVSVSIEAVGACALAGQNEATLFVELIGAAGICE